MLDGFAPIFQLSALYKPCYIRIHFPFSSSPINALHPRTLTSSSSDQNHKQTNNQTIPYFTCKYIDVIMAASISFIFIISLLVLTSSMAATLAAANMNQNFDLTWGGGRAKILSNGRILTLSLDKVSGSGFQSKKEYLFGKIDMQLKLVPGNSAGKLSSQGSNHDEIDFEFLGNVTGQPYTLHTNVYSRGKVAGSNSFASGSIPPLISTPIPSFGLICWARYCTSQFSVDNTPIREFKNLESIGVPFPKSQPMRLYSSLWNADDWATQGGRVKTDWSKAPFTASYRNFNADACVWSKGKSSCSSRNSGLAVFAGRVYTRKQDH